MTRKECTRNTHLYTNVSMESCPNNLASWSRVNCKGFTRYTVTATNIKMSITLSTGKGSEIKKIIHWMNLILLISQTSQVWFLEPGLKSVCVVHAGNMYYKSISLYSIPLLPCCLGIWVIISSILKVLEKIIKERRVRTKLPICH